MRLGLEPPPALSYDLDRTRFYRSFSVFAFLVRLSVSREF